MVSYLLVALGKPGSLELEPGLNRVGRNPTNDLRVSDASVSSFHCEITLADDSVLVRDLCSTNGTFVDGQPVQEATLAPGQVLRFGAAEFRLDRVEISIPKLTQDALPTPAQLADGSPACLNHRDEPACFRCTHCQHTFCGRCVHFLGLSGTQPKAFCPRCSGQCEQFAEMPAQPPAKLSILGRLTQTIRIEKK